MSKSSATNDSIGFIGLLQLLFIALKLLKISEVANWSWWWVLAPTWIPLAIVGAIFFIILLIKIYL